MKYINSVLIFFLSVLSTSSLAHDQFQKIDFEKKWFGKSYSIGQKETGIFGAIREFNQVKEAIKSHPKENKHFRNFQLINVGTTIGIVAYIVGRDKDEEERDSFDEDLFFHSWAALIVSGHFARKQFDKAVKQYNDDISISTTLNSSSFGINVSLSF